MRNEAYEASAAVAADGRQARRSRYPKLHPARGRSASKVAAHQRARLHAAMIELVVDDGYEALTVRQLVQRAGVSTRAFYQQFRTKEECFLGTYDLLMAQMARRIAAAYAGERSWHRQLHLAFEVIAREVAKDPRAAQFALVEAPGVGPGAVVDRLEHASEVLVAMLNRSFGHAPEAIELPPQIIRGIVAGLMRIIRAYVLDGREAELPDQVEEMLEWALCIRNEAAMELEHVASRAAIAPLNLDSWPAGDQDVPGDDRALILSAAARLGASGGYGELSIPRIRAAAGVSRRTFDAHFASVKECFLDALELRVGKAFTDAASHGAGSRTWSAAVYRTLAALCVHVARDPLRARLVFVEVFAAGPEGVRHRARLVGSVSEYLMSRAPAERRATRLGTEASVGAVWGILHHQIVTGNTERLPRLAATLSYLVLAPVVGPATAVREIRAEAELARSAP